MSDVRGYSGIAETTDPSALAHLLNEHRAAMNHAILDEDGTVMQFVGDAVMACFGAPVPQDDHADRAFAAAVSMLEAQVELDAAWAERGLPPFGLGIGISTGPGRGRAARLGGAPRVHARRRHGEPRAATPGSRAPGRLSRVQRGDAGRAHLDARLRGARRAGGQGPAGRGARVSSTRWSGAPITQEEHHDRREPDPRDPGTAQELRVRGRAGAGAARRRLHDEARRVRRGHGPVGLRQVDAAEPRRRARHRRPTARSRSRASRSSGSRKTSSRSCGASTSASCSSSSTCSRA